MVLLLALRGEKMKTIGQRIRDRRKELDMSQEELAAKLGYKHKSSIGKIENGQQDIVQSKVVEIAHALDTTVAFLMGWEEEEVLRQLAANKAFHDELDPLIEQMPENLRQALLSYAYLLLGKDGQGKG